MAGRSSGSCATESRLLYRSNSVSTTAPIRKLLKARCGPTMSLSLTKAAVLWRSRRQWFHLIRGWESQRVDSVAQAQSPVKCSTLMAASTSKAWRFVERKCAKTQATNEVCGNETDRGKTKQSRFDNPRSFVPAARGVWRCFMQASPPMLPNPAYQPICPPCSRALFLLCSLRWMRGGSVGCEEHDMRLMMQGLTDAVFEQRFGAEDACLAALAAARQGGRHGVPTLRQSKELRLWAPGRLHPLQPALVGALWHGYGRYQ